MCPKYLFTKGGQSQAVLSAKDILSPGVIKLATRGNASIFCSAKQPGII